ncbi:hypothetical protein GCM10023116_24770 [Kistimonas scapharcae]|uniref:PPM-type phosphatase domain-containing protein n=2 Tax=Kistimonas scapharcae TaxID=1036133 RepID=A0ABP8V3P1_9GAMM
MPSSCLAVLTRDSGKLGCQNEDRPPSTNKDITIADNRHYKLYSELDSDHIDYIEQLEYRILTGDEARAKISGKLDSALRRALFQQQREREMERESETSLSRQCLFLQAPTLNPKLALQGPIQGTITIGDIPFHYLTRITSSTVGVAYSVGKKRKHKPIEDKYIAETFTIKVFGETIKIDIHGVFDGSGKPDFAEYAANNITIYLTKRLEEFIHKYGFTDWAIREALKIACVDINRTCHRTSCGTTANFALFLKGTLWLVNVGDSRALWVDQYGQVTQLSEDAKPNIDRFKKSILKRGGYVTFGKDRVPRVNQKLGPARYFGFHELNGVVSARPTIVKIDLHGIAGYLVQVTDGLTDVASTHTLGKQTYQYYVENTSPALIAVKLNIKAFFAGSLDNSTAVVTDLAKYSGRTNTEEHA